MPPQADRPPSDVRAVLESTGTPFSVAHYGSRAVIFLQGDASDSVLHIESGRIRLSVATIHGKQAICGLAGPGEFLGEEALDGHAGRPQTATAMTAAQVLVVATPQMIRLLRTQPSIAERFIAHLLARNTRLEADLAAQLLESCEQRLARTLITLAGCRSLRPSRCALPDVSQEIIAEMVGTTRSRVNVFMSKFKKLGLIEEDEGVLRVNPALLHIVEQPLDVLNGTSGPFRKR